jgi:hypothetical protein
MLVNRLWPWQWHTATREAAQVVAVNPTARNPVNHGRTPIHAPPQQRISYISRV